MYLLLSVFLPPPPLSFSCEVVNVSEKGAFGFIDVMSPFHYSRRCNIETNGQSSSQRFLPMPISFRGNRPHNSHFCTAPSANDVSRSSYITISILRPITEEEVSLSLAAPSHSIPISFCNLSLPFMHPLLLRCTPLISKMYS